jgi:hypothetical protein
MGNRGRLHHGCGTREIVRNHQHKTWITCVLSFRGRRAAQWEPNRYTPLFFLDEAVALAAGHRPCGECRHRAYTTFRTLWAETHSSTRVYAKDMDTQLHRERISGTGQHHPWDRLPTGCSSPPSSGRPSSPVTISRSGTNTTTAIATSCHVPVPARRPYSLHRPSSRYCAPDTPYRLMALPDNPSY